MSKLTRAEKIHDFMFGWGLYLEFEEGENRTLYLEDHPDLFSMEDGSPEEKISHLENVVLPRQELLDAERKEKPYEVSFDKVAVPDFPDEVRRYRHPDLRELMVENSKPLKD